MKVDFSTSGKQKTLQTVIDLDDDTQQVGAFTERASQNMPSNALLGELFKGIKAEKPTNSPDMRKTIQSSRGFVKPARKLQQTYNMKAQLS